MARNFRGSEGVCIKKATSEVRQRWLGVMSKRLGDLGLEGISIA
jgi:hypothetical protein